jgi:hypothetical protein
MIAFLVGDDDIDCMLIVELVELEAAVEHRNVPFQEVDEDALAVLEHCSKSPVAARLVTSALDDDRHLISPQLRSQHRGAPLSAKYQEMGVLRAVEEADFSDRVQGRRISV